MIDGVHLLPECVIAYQPVSYTDSKKLKQVFSDSCQSRENATVSFCILVFKHTGIC